MCGSRESGNSKSLYRKRLKRSNISKEIRSETLLVFDALFHNIIRQGFDKDTIITVKTSNSYGEIKISLGFEGEPFVAISDEATSLSEDDAVLQKYEDKFDYSYQSGYNSIHIIVQRSFQNTVLVGLASIVMAILVYIPINAFMSPEAQIQLGDIAGMGGLEANPSLKELIESLVPSSIFEPFETIMPFPLIFVALIVTYAFCSAGRYFDRMKKAVETCYTLFSRMLHIVMFAFPFFCFLALLYPLLGSGLQTSLPFWPRSILTETAISSC